jgi:hemoglobin
MSQEPAQAGRRAALIDDITDRTGIDEDMLRRLVYTFYDRIRTDPFLGPIFDARIEDWPVHLEHMVDFWSSVALMTGRYHGMPMPKHVSLPIDARHFDGWLRLFEATAEEVCPPPASAFLIDRARRIAASLELGVALKHGVLLGKDERFYAASPE